MSSQLRLIAPGLALIAVSYGLARFSFGLFLPQIRADVGVDPALAGVIGGGSYVGYCSAILLSAALVERLGPRLLAVAAGLVATAGLGLIAFSANELMLAAAVLFAGMSTGLASPPMADAVTRLIPEAGQPRANTVINSGSSIGVAVTGPFVLLLAGEWRLAYLVFALSAAIVTLWVAMRVPGRLPRGVTTDRPSTTCAARHQRRPRAVPVLLAAAGMGFASAIYWTFAGDVIVARGNHAPHVAGLAWAVIGVTGIGGAFAGDLVRRFGIDIVHRATLGVLAGAIMMLALVPASMGAVLISAAVFGPAYVMLTGVYLVWGVRVYPDRPAIGLGLPFLMIALGQAAGAPVAGALIGASGYPAAFTVFAGIALATMLTGEAGSPHSRPSRKAPSSSESISTVC